MFRWISYQTLARSLCSEAETQGALVLTGQADHLAETPPYGPWAEALFHAPYGLDGLTPPSLGAISDQATNLATLFAQVREYLADISRQRPVIVVLEDLHWADPASLDLLRYLARDLTNLPLLLIVTYRADELTRHHPLSPLIPVLVRQHDAIRLDLHHLNADDMRALVATHHTLPSTDTDQLVDYLEERVLGRSLRREEAREVQDIARRITALLLLEPELDANYQEVKASVYPWPQNAQPERAGWGDHG